MRTGLCVLVASLITSVSALQAGVASPGRTITGRTPVPVCSTREAPAAPGGTPSLAADGVDRLFLQGWAGLPDTRPNARYLSVLRAPEERIFATPVLQRSA